MVMQNETGVFGDVPILFAIHSTVSPQLDTFAQIIVKFGEFWVIFVIPIATLLIVMIRQKWRSLIYMLITLPGSLVIKDTAKEMIQRSRPQFWQSSTPHSYSFPSGHTMVTTTVVMVLVILLWQTRWRWLILLVGILLVLAISWTRLYLGVHYPSDMIAAWMVSIAWTIGISLLIRPHRR